MRRKEHNGRRIDRSKVQAQARKLDGTGVRVWLGRAIELLPDEAFAQLVADYVSLDDVMSDGSHDPDLLGSVRRFHRSAMAGQYYQDFNVNSRNCMELSRGTETFIAEHTRLVEACLRAEAAGDASTASEGLGLLLDLLRAIDRCEDDIIFFADEAGAWQVGTDYLQVLPAWFRSLSPTTDPDEWAETVVDTLNAFADHELRAILKATRAVATAAQRTALAVREADLHRRR